MKIVRHPNIVRLHEVCIDRLIHKEFHYISLCHYISHMFLYILGFGQPDQDLHNSRVCNGRGII